MRIRRIVGAFLIIMSLLVMLIPATEADAETSASAFSIKGGELIKYSGKEKTVSVPDTVTSIGKGAFENNTTVEKIILPDSVKQIRAYAFWGCDNLKTVALGKGLSSIGDYAFLNCTGLETMTIPSNISSIGIQSFAECKRLEDITIPPQVFDIREDAFDGDYLLNIHCEEGSYADKYAKEFYERQKEMTIYGEFQLPDNEEVTVIQKPIVVPADGVYSGADVMGNQQTTEKVPEEDYGYVFGSSTVVGNQAFVFTQKMGIPVIGDTQGVASAYVVSGGAVLNEALKNNNHNNTQDENATQIDSDATIDNIPIAKPVNKERAHYRDAACTEFEMPENKTAVGDFAYARSGLKQLEIPEGIEKIGYASFYHCDNLEKVILPQSVKSVQSNAFAHTPWLNRFLNGEQSELGDYLISGGVLIAYRGNAPEVIIPEEVRAIAGDAFADHNEIKKIILPASVQYIDDRAFNGCSPENVEYTGNTIDSKVLEEAVHLNNALSQGLPEEQAMKIAGVPWYFALFAGVLFLSGVVCIFKERY